MHRLLIGESATSACLGEIARHVSLQSPDFLHLHPPHSILALDAWLDALQLSPVCESFRYGFLQDAHELSEVALGRTLDLLEHGLPHLKIWLSARGALHPTVHSRLLVSSYGGDGTESKWSELFARCLCRLKGSVVSSDWDEWREVLRAYKCYVYRVPEYQCISMVEKLRIVRRVRGG
jgi:hypothetical protein